MQNSVNSFNRSWSFQVKQEALDIITQGFASLGLKMNATKTEYMVMAGGRNKVILSTVA